MLLVLGIRVKIDNIALLAFAAYVQHPLLEEIELESYLRLGGHLYMAAMAALTCYYHTITPFYD